MQVVLSQVRMSQKDDACTHRNGSKEWETTLTKRLEVSAKTEKFCGITKLQYSFARQLNTLFCKYFGFKKAEVPNGP